MDIQKIIEVLEELADDLEAEVQDRYMPEGYSVHKSQLLKYQRDMAPVIAGREMIAELVDELEMEKGE